MVVKVVDFSAPCDNWETRRLADMPDRVVAGDPTTARLGGLATPAVTSLLVRGQARRASGVRSPSVMSFAPSCLAMSG